MDKQIKQYTKEEESAAFALLFLAGSLSDQEFEASSGPSSISSINGEHGNDSPTPSDTTADLTIEEGESTKKEEEDEDDTLTPSRPPTPLPTIAPEKEDNKELTEFLSSCNLESLIGRMTQVALTTKRAKGDLSTGRINEETNLRRRLEKFINEEEVQGTKYHASMKRVYASAANRPLAKQINREKNNTASRLSRIRLRNAEQNLRVDAVKKDSENMAKRMKKAALLFYIQALHYKLKLPTTDFKRPAKELLMEYGVEWDKLKKAKEELAKQKNEKKLNEKKII